MSVPLQCFYRLQLFCRIIERRNEACALNHVVFAALHCLRDKFDRLVAQWEGASQSPKGLCIMHFIPNNLYPPCLSESKDQR